MVGLGWWDGIGGAGGGSTAGANAGCAGGGGGGGWHIGHAHVASWSRPCSQLDARSTYVYPQAVEEVSMPGNNQSDADAVFDAAATKVQAVLRGATARKRSVAGVRLSPHSNPNPNPNPSPNPDPDPDPPPGGRRVPGDGG